MDLRDTRTFFAYNWWANRRLLEAVRELTAEEIARDLGGSFRSVEGTLRHLVWGEGNWLRFWREDAFGPDLVPADLPDLPAIEAAWKSLEDAQHAYVRELTDERLREPRRVDEDEYVLGELVQHCLNHSTHHRGQIVHMLRELGRTPPGTGFRQFLAASRRTS